MVALVDHNSMDSQASAIDAIVAAGTSSRGWPADIRMDYRNHVRDRLYTEARFLLVLGFLVAVASSVVDVFIAPDMVQQGFFIRMVAVAPFTALGLWAVKLRKPRLLSASLGLAQMGFAAALMYLASFLPITIAVQYHLGVALLLGLSTVIVPYSSRYLIAFNLGYIAMVTLALAIGGVSAILARLEFLSILTIVAAATLPVARRFELLRQRNFLLTLRHRMAAEELESTNRLLRELSERDPLTGMHNRRYFERAFKEGGKQVKPHDRGLVALMMIDLDHFKAFNDRHGHQAGDYCLKTVGSSLRAVFATYSGMVARYGGEEFIGCARVDSVEHACTIGEDIRLAVAGLPGRGEGSPLVTTSVGVAVIALNAGFTMEDMIEMADSALYSAKRAGRDRVEVIETVTQGSRPAPEPAFGT